MLEAAFSPIVLGLIFLFSLLRGAVPVDIGGLILPA